MIGVIFAEDPSYFYKQNDIIDLKIACSNSGTVCGTSATCNISVFYPNSTVLIDQQTMTNNGDYHNYTIGSISVVGEYSARTFCCDDSDCGNEGFFFEINTRGTTSKPIMVGIYTVLIILIALFFYLAVSLNIFPDDHSNMLLRVYLFFLAFAHILATIFLSYLDYNDFTGISSLLITLFSIDAITVLLVVYFYFMNKAEDAVDKAMKSIDRDFNG